MTKNLDLNIEFIFQNIGVIPQKDEQRYEIYPNRHNLETFWTLH